MTDKNTKIAVIGLGHVGLPLAALFAQHFTVYGIDTDQIKVNKVCEGVVPFKGKEPLLDELLTNAISSRNLWATPSYEYCQFADAIFVCVETPIDEKRCPDYTALKAALNSLRPHLVAGVTAEKEPKLIVIESTLAPGTMDGVVKLILEGAGLEAGVDFHLAHAPERIMPGKLIHNLRSMPRVIGGHTDKCALKAASLYRHIVERGLHITDMLTAEITKTAENAYRDTKIAFANELAMVCYNLSANFWKVRELMNSMPNQDVLKAGAGVGGHCIPKDPWLLIQGSGPRNFIESARRVNEWMPFHTVGLFCNAMNEAGRKVKGAHVAILGFSYLENCGDTRNSPSMVVLNELYKTEAQVWIHDPYVDDERLYINTDPFHAVHGCDAIIVMTAHDEYYDLDLEDLYAEMNITSDEIPPVLIDGRNVFTPEQAQQAGFVYRSIGVGPSAELRTGLSPRNDNRFKSRKQKEENDGKDIS